MSPAKALSNKGKFSRFLDIRCPDCEEQTLQERSLEGSSFILCTECGYFHENSAKNKKNIAKLREMKNEEAELH